MPALRRPLLTVICAAVLVPVASAQALEPPPVTPWPPWITTPFVVEWGAADFSPLALQPGYDVEVYDPATGTPVSVRHVDGIPGSSVSFIHTTLVSGSEIGGRVRAGEIPCLSFAPDGACERYSSTRETSPWREIRARIDTEPPSGTVRVEYGARFVNGLDVPVLLRGTDPSPGSGMGWVQMATTLPYTCPAFGAPDPTCPFPYRETAFSFRLPADSRDGVHTIFAAWRDAAVQAGAPPGTMPGNEGNIGFTRVLLDRVAPTAVPAVVGVFPARQGGWQVNLSAGGSHDDDGDPANDSGLSATGYRWTFEDGVPVQDRPDVFRVYPDPGVHQATLVVSDNAGNTSSPATVTIYAGVEPPAPATPSTPVAPPDSGSPPASGTPVGTPTGEAPPPAARVRVASLRLSGAMRARRPATVRVTLTRRARVRLSLARIEADGRSGRVVVRRTRAGDVAPSTMRFTAPRAGLYRMTVTAGNHRVVRRVRVLAVR